MTWKQLSPRRNGVRRAAVFTCAIMVLSFTFMALFGCQTSKQQAKEASPAERLVAGKAKEASAIAAVAAGGTVEIAPSYQGVPGLHFHRSLPSMR